MTGRQEHTLQIEARLRRRLVNAPSVIQDYYYNFGDKTAQTKQVYISHILTLNNYFKEKDLTSLSRTDINRYLESQKYYNKNGELKERSVSFRRVELAAIKDFYSFLVNEDIISTNPCNKINPPRFTEEKEIIALTPSEVQTVKNNITNGCGTHREDARRKEWINRDLAIVTLGCNTGLRCTAITEIDLDDIDFENNTIKVIEKGNKGRIIYVGESAMEVIKRWIEDRSMHNVKTNALFISNRGQRITQGTIRDVIRKYTININKHITPHKMRSSCATNLYEQTGDIYLVQEVLGHKNIANTRRYAKLSEGKKRNAANILDKLF